MPSQLTSVRFDDELLEDARLVAEAEESSVAEVIREALRAHVRSRLADPSIQGNLRASHERQMARLERYAHSQP